MKKNFWIISDNGLFPQRMNAFESIDTKSIWATLAEEGFDVFEATYCDIINGRVQVKNSFVLYASSQIPERKAYIDDALYFINRPENKNVLLPNYDMFRCHENKGYQELYKKIVGINSLSANYFIDYNETMPAPSVLKLLNGYGSKNVFLIKKEEDYPLVYEQYVRKPLRKQKLKILIKKKLKGRFTQNILKYDEQFLSLRYVQQSFVPALKSDFKVLIFGEKVYVLKRFVKKNDFRASGSGLREFSVQNTVPLKVLDFAYECYRKLDTPFVSLDICTDEKDCYLIEFQGVHFGPFTLLNSNGYFDPNKNWEFVTEIPNLEREMAAGIIQYIKRA